MQLKRTSLSDREREVWMELKSLRNLEESKMGCFPHWVSRFPLSGYQSRELKERIRDIKTLTERCEIERNSLKDQNQKTAACACLLRLELEELRGPLMGWFD